MSLKSEIYTKVSHFMLRRGRVVAVLDKLSKLCYGLRSFANRKQEQLKPKFLTKMCNVLCSK